MKVENYTITGKSKFDIKKFETEIKSSVEDTDLKDEIDELALMQDMLYAQDHYGVLVIIQAMDTAGKDGIIKHVMTGLNPQATQVHSFKQPSAEELDHTWLWKAQKFAPERGNITIFNRSYYEEVLVVKVHDLLSKQKVPTSLIDKNKIWSERYNDIVCFEDHLNRNGIEVVKLFLHISKDEQKKRLLERIDDKAKNWKFSDADLKERGYWNDYMKAYEEMINGTSTKKSPWYVIPADKKKIARLLVSEILIERMKAMNLHYPTLEKSKEDILQIYKDQLMND
jgi:PPK2 family polyphosphate:nucleotide phosphotransferase